MRIFKLCLIALITFLIAVEIPFLINDVVSFSMSPVLAQTPAARKTEADQLLREGIERLQEKMDTNQADATLNLFQQALTIYREIQDHSGEGQVLKNLGNFYYLREDYSKALDYAQQTLKVAKEIQDRDLEARALNNQGLAYYWQKNYPPAIASYQEGLVIAQKIANRELEFLLSYNLANAYKYSKDLPNAINLYQQALVMARELNNLPGQYGILNNLAGAYEDAGNKPQANELYQQARKIAQQLDIDTMNSQPTKEIEGIRVPSTFNISLQGETDGQSFGTLSGTLEIQPSSSGDPNPFLVSLYMNAASPEELTIGSLFWQSYLPDHPQRQEHYSQITVTNGQVRMEVNPSEGFRSDFTWFTRGSLVDQLRKLDEELNQINEEINQRNEELGQPRIEIDSTEIPNRPNRLGVVAKSGILTFSIQGNQISGTINASGISDEGQSSTYRAKFTGEIVTKKSETTAPNPTNENNIVTKPIKKQSLPIFQSRLLPVPSARQKGITKTIKADLSKAKVTLSLTGTKEPQFQNLQGAWWGTEQLQVMFLGANWIFSDDNTFVFAPPPMANVSDDLYPIFGTYSKVDNIWKFQGERQWGGSSTSVDGTIFLEGDKAVLDAIYTVSAMDSQKIARISQTLSQGNVQATYSPPKTEIEGIKVPSVFKISLQGETDDKSFGTLSGILKIKPNHSTKNPNPFVVTLETDARDRNGSLSWISEEVLSSVKSQITVNNNQVSLQLKSSPSSGIFPDLTWWAFPSSRVNESNNSPLVVTGIEGALIFKIQNNQISGTIKATGNSSAWQSSTYQANFTGEIETLPPSFQGVWQEKSLAAFGEVTLQQDGEKVYGTYTGHGGGTIEGIVQQNRLNFTWKGSDKEEGEGFFRAVSDGRTLTGIWETEISPIEKTSFLAERTKESYRNPIATELAEDKWYLKDLGADLVLQGRCDQALKPLEEALTLYQKERSNTENYISTTYGYLIDEANLIRNLTHCHFQLQDYEDLITSLENAVEIRQAMNQTKYLSPPTPQQANLIRSVLASYVENWRQRLTKDADKIVALDKAQPFLQKLITYLVELDAKEEALLASEIARARAFADLLATQVSPKSTRPITANPPTIKQIQQIAREQNATLVEYWIVGDELIEPNKLQTQESTQESELYIWVVQPNGKIEFRSVDLKFSGNSLNQIVTEAREFMGVGGKARGNTVEPEFKPGDLVRITKEPLEYLREVVSVYPERNTAAVRFANAPNSPIREILVSELEKASSPINIRLQKLHEILIKPIAQLLPTNPEAHIIFIPHQELFLLPFPALQDQQGQYLIDKYTILTSPAIQVLESTHKRRQQVLGKAQEVLVVGNPSPMPGDFKPIKGSEEEAKAVAKRLKTQAIIGQEATEKNIRQKLSQARLIHLATHGKFDDRNPLQGAIALAPSNEYDGLLTAEKILNLGYQINAELVVLSACDTGQGKISGDGVIGLSRSWMAAGVPSIIVSLWQVPDENATPLLMDKFYEKYHENNSDKAKALRKAMQTTKSQYPEPKNWTAFTLIGEAN